MYVYTLFNGLAGTFCILIKLLVNVLNYELNSDSPVYIVSKLVKFLLKNRPCVTSYLYRMEPMILDMFLGSGGNRL